MDLHCTRCGEPWDLDYVLHDEPEEFKFKKGSKTIIECPACRGKDIELDPQQRAHCDNNQP